MEKKAGVPVIVCSGEHGRAVVYGLASGPLVPGEPVTLRRARMVLRWDVHGLFGFAAAGPRGDTRLTHEVEETTITRWTESLAVSPAARAAIEGWRAYGG
jgi:hypothetical protein